MGGKCHDRDVSKGGVRAEYAHRFEPVHVWHSQIHEDEIWHVISGERNPFLRIRGTESCESTMLQVGADDLARVLKIIHEQNKRPATHAISRQRFGIASLGPEVRDDARCCHYAVDDIFCPGHTADVTWAVEVTEEFEAWWNQLSDDHRVSIDGMIRVLEAHGPSLGHPYSSDVRGSRHLQLRQLLVPHHDREICVLYVPVEERSALVLLTGVLAKPLDDACPPPLVTIAEAIYERFLSRRTPPR